MEVGDDRTGRFIGAEGPNLFLVGMQRSATTALAAYLGRHPEVFMATKELQYFGRDLPGRGEPMDRAAYLRHFAGAGDRRIRGDASVGYLPSATAAEEIAAAAPDARVVASFRHPVDMAYSLYSLLRFQGMEPSPSFAAALDDPQLRWAQTATAYCWGFRYRELMAYSDKLRRYLETFGPDRVHVVVYEDFVADPDGCYRRLLEFLGVDPGAGTTFEPINANRQLRSRRLQRWHRDPPPWLRAVGHVVLPSRSWRGRLGRQVAARNEPRTSRPALDPALRQRLERELAPDVAALGTLLGRDLTSLWLDRPVVRSGP